MNSCIFGYVVHLGRKQDLKDSLMGKQVKEKHIDFEDEEKKYFGSGVYRDGCNRTSSSNNAENKTFRHETAEANLELNPNAFRPNILVVVMDFMTLRYELPSPYNTKGRFRVHSIKDDKAKVSLSVLLFLHPHGFKLARSLMCILEHRVSYTSTHLMVALSATQIPLSRPTIPSGLILRATRLISSNWTLASLSWSQDEETETVLVSLRTEKSIREI
ncbi:hypothetical protein MKX03_005145 [Papaver bracteatum]|nr:hypothetical protein MKX03_005145 [Papaver bracteatum]